MHHTIRVASLAVLISSLLVLTVACASEQPSGGAADTEQQGGEPVEAPGELIVAQSADVQSLDPTMQRDGPSFIVTDHIYDTLVYRDRNFSIQPRLAESWTWVDDTTLEMKLREGVTFHNGEPFNAEAVAFSMERNLDPNLTFPPHPTMVPIEGVDVVDEHTIQIVTSEPYPGLLAALVLRPMILPPQYIEENGWDHLHANPVGTGPYAFVEWVPDERVVLEANPDWFAGEPPIERLVFRPIPDQATRYNELLTGGVDLIRDLSPDLIESVEENPDLRVEATPDTRMMVLYFQDVEPLRDVRVRRAIGHAIDREALVRDVLRGIGEPARLFVSPLSTPFDPDLEGFTYDPDLARSLLEEAGYGNGLQFSVAYPTGAYLRVSQIAQVMAAQLAEVGVEMEIVATERGVFTERAQEGTLDEEAYLFAGANPFGLSMARLWNLLHSTATYTAGSDFFEVPLDEELDAAQTVVDPEEQLEVLARIHGATMEAVPAVPLYTQMELTAVRERVIWEGPVTLFPLLWTASLREE